VDSADAGKAQAHDAVSLVEEVLREAVSCGASDVHFEPTRQDMLVRFRIDGALAPARKIPKSLAENVISRLKVLGGLLTYRNDVPQEGRLQLPAVDGAQVTEQRLAIFPTVHGQRAAVRIFYEETALTELDQLGFSPNILASLKAFAAQPQGVLLLTGPAGSGKSTTLGAMLRHILASFPGKSVVSLEDPVERHIDGVTQVQISTSGGAMSYPVALRSLLRQDPEVLMIGEIRDAQTAAIVVEAGLTGHQLLSTMHSGSPAGAILRLLEMGLEPYQVTSSLSAVVNQRLLRKLCPDCRKVGTDPTFRWPESGVCPYFSAVGCPRCMNTGFRGRTLVAEALELDGGLRKAVLGRADLEEMESILAARGHMDIRHDAQRLVAQGVTTRQEMVRACGAGKD
jgi:type II secretory ATPase GspE/PulE/Tfp pilus assembly ATPase PilB-like protein